MTKSLPCARHSAKIFHKQSHLILMQPHEDSTSIIPIL